MQTSSPFLSFSPKHFIKRRFAPLFVTVVEDEVDTLFRTCGLTFTDFLAAVAFRQPNPVRVLPHTSVLQESQETFFSNVSMDVMQSSQSFVFKEYETHRATDPNLSPFPARFPDHIHYPSPVSMRPPWWQFMVERLLSSLQFSDFDFCDLPACVVYASLAGGASQKAEQVRQLLSFPKWMLEFLLDIPIVKVVVYDNITHRQRPAECDGPRQAFGAVFGLPFRSRRLETPGAIDPVTLKGHFEFDPHLTSDPSLGAYLTQTDLDECNKLLRGIYGAAKTKLEQVARAVEFEIENSNQLSTRLKDLFTKKAPERLTQHLAIPWRRMMHLRVAGIYFILGQHEAAWKAYKNFIASLTEGQLPEFRITALFQAALAGVLLPNGAGLFKTSVREVLGVIAQVNSIRFLLMVPSIGVEFHADAGEFVDASSLCRAAINKISRLWTGNAEMKSVILALFYERMAGLTQNPVRSLYATARAAMFYQQGNQPPHKLRCLIWIISSLSRTNGWILLYQNAWLEKAEILCTLGQWGRALTDCKELLALKDLHWSLHAKVISQFWSPFNDSSLTKDQLLVKMDSLLEVKKLQMIDKTSPEYWGFTASDFHVMIVEFDNWYRQIRRMSRDVSMDIWYDDDDAQRSAQSVRSVAVGNEIQLIVGLSNRYRFSVHLDRALLRADYSGEESGTPYHIEAIANKNIPGCSSEITCLSFKFVPLQVGSFTVNAFEKNYWGYVDTVIKCGPLTFSSITNLPKLTLEIKNFPQAAWPGQCELVEFVIKNTGDSNLRGFVLVVDHPDRYVCDWRDIIKLENVILIQYQEPVVVEESITVPVVFQAGETGVGVFHFFVAVAGMRCAFDIRKVVVKDAATFRTVPSQKANDTVNVLHYCTVTAAVDGIEVVGLVNHNSRLLKTAGLKAETLAAGESCSFLGFQNDATADKVEKWRGQLLGSASCAILFKAPGLSRACQYSVVATEQATCPYRLTLTMPNRARVALGAKLKCVVQLKGAKADTPGVYIQPLPFKYSENGSTTNERCVGCQWVGIRKRKLVKENGFRAEFDFAAYTSGIFEIPGFYLFQPPNYTGSPISLSQTIQIIPI
jgi:hypothetical protein